MPTNESVPRETIKGDLTDEELVEVLFKISLKIYPFLGSLIENHGAKHTIAALATIVSELADQQTNPDGAVEQFISLLKEAHYGNKSVPRETSESVPRETFEEKDKS